MTRFGSAHRPRFEALRSAELDDPSVFCEYPRSTVNELERALGVSLGGDGFGAPSGACTYGHLLRQNGLAKGGSTREPTIFSLGVVTDGYPDLSRVSLRKGGLVTQTTISDTGAESVLFPVGSRFRARHSDFRTCRWIDTG